MGYFGWAKVEFIWESKTPKGNNLGFLEAFILGLWLAFNEAICPEAILVQNGDHCILKVPVVVKIDTAIQGGGIPLPDGAILTAVEELNQQGAGPHVVFLLVVVEVLVLRLHPVFNIRLVIPVETEAVLIHLKGYDQVRTVFGLLIPQKPHPGNDGLFNNRIYHAGIRQSRGAHDFKSAILLEIAAVAVVILHG